jgi:molybdate transport repressor ModE-like protein
MMKKERHSSSRRAHSGGTWPLDLESRQLRTFVMLVDRGSMSAAARALGVAQSTVSEVVAALERALGTRIVTRRRGGHGVTLTKAGEALLPYARSVLASLEDAHLAVAAVDHEVRASIEVIANESVSTYLLPRALGTLRTRWPNMRFSVTAGMCPKITDGLSTGRYDLGLMLQTSHCAPKRAAAAGEPPSGATRGLPLAEIPLVVFGGAAHPLTLGVNGAKVRRDQLAPYTLFVSDARGHFFDLIRDFFRADGVPGPRLEPTGSVEAVKRSVTGDRLGLGVLPVYAVADELRANRLRTLPMQPELPPVQLEALVYHTRPPTHPAVAALLEVLRTTADWNQLAPPMARDTR